ncbi:MAG: polyprenyl synthetase family protein [Rhizobiales bacterium]|nr:polyprenyl synthetase family protein [Hyphomicrobiales bacterium]
METGQRIEKAIERAMRFSTRKPTPPKLADAMHYTMFPGGARVRPRLCLAVAAACGDDQPHMSDAAAVAIELLHTASLVHDDMPCFDDAAVRRGKAAVHSVYGEPIALLVGDALIVAAFDTIAREAAWAPERVGPLIATVARAVGTPEGIAAGQAWESEEKINIEAYHLAKTGALFVGAAMAGALAAGADSYPWRAMGECLGAAYQLADDLRDAVLNEQELGKPARQDTLHDRPNAVETFGLSGTLSRLQGLIEDAIDAIPSCPGEVTLQKLIQSEAQRLTPKQSVQAVA